MFAPVINCAIIFSRSTAKRPTTKRAICYNANAIQHSLFGILVDQAHSDKMHLKGYPIKMHSLATLHYADGGVGELVEPTKHF